MPIRRRETTSPDDSSVDIVSSVSKGRIDAPRNLATTTIENSLAALQVGGAFATHIPFISSIAGLLMQVLTLRDEVKQYKTECKIVMRKLTRIANVILTVNNSCVKYNLNEDDLGNGLRTILGSLEEELNVVDDVLQQCAKASRVKGFLLRKRLLEKIRQCDNELSSLLESVLLELSLEIHFTQISIGRSVLKRLSLLRFGLLGFLNPKNQKKRKTM